jgi:hypothetical protein
LLAVNGRPAFWGLLQAARPCGANVAVRAQDFSAARRLQYARQCGFSSRMYDFRVLDLRQFTSFVDSTTRNFELR